MILRSFNGLRYEALSPSEYVFRLGEESSLITIHFNGVAWVLTCGENSMNFATLEHATTWLSMRIELAEQSFKVRFHFAHLEKPNDGYRTLK